MKRQLSANEYQLKDWVINAITLAEAFLSRSHFSQAEYLLYAAYHIIPQDAQTDDEKGLKATVQMQLGKYYQKRLEVGIALYAEGQEWDQEKVSRKDVEFPEL